MVRGFSSEPQASRYICRATGRIVLPIGQMVLVYNSTFRSSVTSSIDTRISVASTSGPSSYITGPVTK